MPAPKLIVFSGLPGVGKTTLSRELAQQLGATYIRIDSVETALKVSSLKIDPAEEAGYLASAAIAMDNLKNGLTVIADAVNPVNEARQLWSDAARNSGAALINVEITCTDRSEHQQRVESRVADLDGLQQPGWQIIQKRRFEPWSGDVQRLDTAGRNVQDCVAELLNIVAAQDPG